MIADEATVRATLTANVRSTRAAIVSVLEARFGSISTDLVDCIEQITDEETLRRLVRLAATCSDEKSFIRKIGA